VLQLVSGPLGQALRSTHLSEQLRRSRGEVVGVLEEERRRMRRDLHDGLGPTLAGVAASADAAANLLQSKPDEAAALVQQLRIDVGEAIAEIRRIVYGLRPRALDELGLVGAVRQRTGRLRASNGDPLQVDVTAADLPDLPAAVEVAAYRVAVEAVTNVARHAAADAAQVLLQICRDGALEVVVSDNGAGTPPWIEGVGIASMRERVEQLGGSLHLGSGRDGGSVRARLPLPP
jgi:signal transduction histidine kinase